METLPNRRAGSLVIAVAGTLLVAAVSARQASRPLATDDTPRVTVLSSWPDMVTGGDALIHVSVTSAERSSLHVVANGLDVTNRFRDDAFRGGVIGLVANLHEGANSLVAASGSATLGHVQLVNYPITGPVFSGPHEKPFICDSTRFKLQTGETLGEPRDANCSVVTRVDYEYRSKSGKGWVPLPDHSASPSDAASVTTSTGVTVPFVVRIETGTVNRGIYQISMLHDPSAGPAPDFISRSAGWNGRLIYTFGGGCGGGWHKQGATTGGVDDEMMLSLGYAVASSSLNVFGNNCNDLLASETMMMVKERFIEAYGPPAFTIGWGCSGGSYQAHQTADNYPGLLDGIVVGCSFPDVGYTSISVHSFGARLLYHYFTTATVRWSEAEQVNASGLPDYNSLKVQGTRPDRISPRDMCEGIPEPMLYDPVSNPHGVRCTVYDHTVNVYGRDPATGFARRFLDNVGVQYGLVALNAGDISPTQFLDLNEHIGGVDVDGRFTTQRTVGDPVALRVAYRSGRILWGGGGLASTPIIDYRGYSDFSNGDPHMRFFSFVTRARLMRANGHARNQVMLVEDGATYGLFSTKSPHLREALAEMDVWLAAVGSDRSAAPLAEKVQRAKPADLVDSCFDRDGSRIRELQVYGSSGRCNALFPPHSSPYLAAGMPLTNDTVKCQLKAVAPADYKVRLSADDLARLRRIFPVGVCDYTKAGLEEQPISGTWLSFGPAPANRLGPHG
jgi:hypothetical protein